MDKAVENLNEKAKKLEHLASGTDIALTEMRIQFETLADMQKEERLATQEMHNKEMESLRKHYGRIILSLILTIVLILGTIVGGIAYIFSNFDIISGEFEQGIHIGGDGNPVINDGIHYTVE